MDKIKLINKFSEARTAKYMLRLQKLDILIEQDLCMTKLRYEIVKKICPIYKRIGDIVAADPMEIKYRCALTSRQFERLNLLISNLGFKYGEDVRDWRAIRSGLKSFEPAVPELYDIHEPRIRYSHFAH